MKAGMTLDNLSAEVRRQVKVRQDHIFSTGELKLLTQTAPRMTATNLQLNPQPNSHLNSQLNPQFNPPPLTACSQEQAVLLSGSNGRSGEFDAPVGPAAASHSALPSTSWLSTPSGWFPATSLALEQMAGHLGLPLRYLKKLQQENPNLLDLNVNTLLMQQPRPRLVRLLDGGVRAFLSNRYRRLDNDALLEALWPLFEDLGGLQVGSADLSPQRLYLKLVSPRLTGEVRVGDPVQAGLVISNSEVGAGAVTVELLIYRLICTNGAIVGHGAGQLRRYHSGSVQRPQGGSLLPGADQQTDEPTPDSLFWEQLREAAREALQERHFHEVLERMQQAATQKLEADITTVTGRLAGRFGLRESEQQAVQFRLLESEDLTLWGLANAVTRSSQDIESYERATELERLGGALLHLSPKEWRGLSLN